MIQRLQVKNFALIKDIDINFNEGLTVLTGETGTGKTIILQSLHLLFGKRADQSMIRHGKQKAEVFGVFKIANKVQVKYSLPAIIEVLREIDKTGKHKMMINNNNVTLSYLKEVMESIGSMHSQSDTMQLLDSQNYLSYVDKIDSNKTNILHNKYLESRKYYLKKKNKLEKIKAKHLENSEQKEFHQYQLDDLKSYALIPLEKEKLLNEINKLSSFDNISKKLKETYYMFDTNKINFDNIFQASENLNDISQFDIKYNNYAKTLIDVYYSMKDVKESLYDEIQMLDFNPLQYDNLQERLFLITNLEKKYNKDIAQIIRYTEELEANLLLIDNYDDSIKQATAEMEKAFDKAFKDGLLLSNYRRNLAKQLEHNIIKELASLDLAKARFEIEFEEINNKKTSLLDSGIDAIEFKISLNEGEPLRILSSVASGGERARFMFALRSIYAKQNNLSLLVLDEIDIGISGKTAAKVANKMYLLSKQLQLIVISHLPQVAARADNHLGITKQLMNKRMVTTINELSENQRIEMIALMLSDDSMSHYAIEQAKILISK